MLRATRYSALKGRDTRVTDVRCRAGT